MSHGDETEAEIESEPSFQRKTLHRNSYSSWEGRACGEGDVGVLASLPSMEETGRDGPSKTGKDDRQTARDQSREWRTYRCGTEEQ